MKEYSKRKKNEAIKARLSVEELAMADLIALGWNDWDAFMAMGLYRPAMSDDMNTKLFKQRVDKKEFQEYLETKMIEKEKLKAAAKAQKKKKIVIPTDKDIRDSPLTKEELLNQLLTAANAIKSDDPKKYADILGKYADLQKMKQDEVKTEDSTIHYYLPITCNKCSLYNEAKKLQKDGD